MCVYHGASHFCAFTREEKNFGIMLLDNMFIRHIAPDLLERIKKGMETDSLGQSIIEAIAKKTPLPL